MIIRIQLAVRYLLFLTEWEHTWFSYNKFFIFTIIPFIFVARVCKHPVYRSRLSETGDPGQNQGPRTITNHNGFKGGHNHPNVVYGEHCVYWKFIFALRFHTKMLFTILFYFILLFTELHIQCVCLQTILLIAHYLHRYGAPSPWPKLTWVTLHCQHWCHIHIIILLTTLRRQIHFGIKSI